MQCLMHTERQNTINNFKEPYFNRQSVNQQFPESAVSRHVDAGTAMETVAAHKHVPISQVLHMCVGHGHDALPGNSDVGVCAVDLENTIPYMKLKPLLYFFWPTLMWC